MALSGESFADLRRNLPSEPMVPSAPIYTIDSMGDLDMNAKKEESAICKTSAGATDDAKESGLSLKMMTIELDLKKARLKKELLEKERQMVDEDYRVRIELVESEIAMALSKLESLQDSANEPLSTAVGNSTKPVEPIVTNRNAHVCPTVPRGFDPALDNRVNSYTPIDTSNRGLPAGIPVVLKSIGLEQLRVLDCVTIRQLRAREHTEETYEVVAPGENLVIFRVNVTLHLVDLHRSVRLEFIDSEVKEVMSFQAEPDGFLELKVCGQLAALVKKANTYFKPMLVVYDPLARPMLKVKGPNMSDDKHIFQVQTVKKKCIGHINKQPVPSRYYEANHAMLDFPLDLDVRYKAALIASNFLIVDQHTSGLRHQKMEAALAETSSPVNMARSSSDYPRHVHV